MNFRRNFLILIIFPIIFSASLNRESYGDENSDVKKELKELRQMMEQMQNRIDDLEERNRALEQQAKEKEEPTEEETIVVEEETDLTVIEEPAQQSQGFLSKALNTFNPAISVIGIFAAAYYSQNNPIVFAENDPENTGVNVQEVEVGFQSVVDSYFRFDLFLSFSTEGVELEEAYGTTLLSLPLNS